MKDTRPDIPLLSTVVLNELKENVDSDSIAACINMGGRADTVGMLGQILADSVERSAIYWIDGTAKIFDGKTYEEFTRDDLCVAIRKFVCNPQYGFSPAVSRNGSIQDLVQTVMSTIRTRRLDPDRNLIAFKNGILDLTTKKVSRHSKKLTPFCYLDINYDPTANCFLWEQFLDDVMPPHVEDARKGIITRHKQEILQEYCGALFVDRKKVAIEKMVILLGAGSNGKSVVAHTITSLLGADNCTHFSFDELLSSGDQAKNTAKMNGKVLNYSEEIQAVNCTKYGDRLKALISGESVTARSMWGDPFSAADIPLLMANANKLPKMEDTSNGLRRRLIILNFDKIIPPEKQDLMLSQKLMDEASGIFNWILEGHERFVANGYKFSHLSIITDQVDEYMASNNPVMQFLSETDRHPTYDDPIDSIPTRCTLKELYSEYEQWSAGKHMRMKSYAEMGSVLRTAGFESVRMSSGVAFKCYGKKLTAERVSNEVDMKIYMKNSYMRRKTPFRLSDGRVVAVGVQNAARFVRMSISWMKMMQLQGKFDKALIDEEDRKRLNISKVIDVFDLIKLDSIVTRLWEKDSEAIENAASHEQECRDFNVQMAIKEQPFRKFESGMINADLKAASTSEIIFVDVNWEYSEEAAQKALIEYEKNKLIK